MTIDPKDLVGIIQSIISWSCFFIALAIFKKFITYGLSVAFVEVLKIQGLENRKKMAQWFVNEEDILEYLRETEQERRE